jgi:hypothetical protein
MSDTIESKTLKKLQKERSKVGQEEENLESRDINSSFNENSETERDKTSKRPPTGSQM